MTNYKAENIKYGVLFLVLFFERINMDVSWFRHVLWVHRLSL